VARFSPTAALDLVVAKGAKSLNPPNEGSISTALTSLVAWPAGSRLPRVDTIDGSSAYGKAVRRPPVQPIRLTSWPSEVALAAYITRKPRIAIGRPIGAGEGRWALPCAAQWSGYAFNR